MTPVELMKKLEAFIKKNPKLKDIPMSIVLTADNADKAIFTELKRVSYHGGSDKYEYKPCLEGTFNLGDDLY